MIDYPGKMSCVLFVSGCNFNCPYCHNPDLAMGCPCAAQCVDEDAFFSFLAARTGFLDGVVISGGEPTVQDKLPILCDKIKRMGYPVKLDTNGSRPDMIQRLIDEGLIDYIAMDVKTDPADYPRWIQGNCRSETIAASIRRILASSLPHEFRTTCLRPLIEDRVIENIARRIKGAALYVLQRFRDRDVLHPDFIRSQCSGFSPTEMSHLKSIAEPWVAHCIVR